MPFLLAFLVALVVGVPGPALAEEPDIPVEKPVVNGPGGMLAEDAYTGRPVPSFEAVTTKGRQVSTDRLPAGPLVIDLWGLNCASCLEEMAVLERIYGEFRDSGLEIWSVNSEDIGSEQINEGLRRKGISVSYDLVLDPSLAVTHLFTTWFIPVTVVVDTAGTVQYYKIGFGKKDTDRLRAKVVELLE